MTTTLPLRTECEIQTAYSGSQTAADYVANRFDSELNRLQHQRQVSAVNRVMRRYRPARSLEIAPGPGRVTRDVRPSGDLVCLEYNTGMIEEGRRACPPPVEWIQGNAFELPFDDEFDFVYSFRFIRHFERDDRARLYGQIRKALRPNGLLVFDAVNENVSRPFREARPEAYPIYDKLYRQDELVDELQASGFSDIEFVTVHRFYTWQYRCQTVVGPRSAWLNRLLIRGLERLPGREGLEWVVRCLRV